MINERKDITIEDLQKSVEFNLNNDGYLVPVAFFISSTGAVLAPLDNDVNIDTISTYARNNDIFKVMLISESKLYHAPEGMTQEQIQDVIESQRHHYQFELEQVYQIIEITSTNIRYFTRPYYTEMDSKNTTIVIYGDSLLTEDAHLPQYQSIQDELVFVM